VTSSTLESRKRRLIDMS